jgi:thymidine kinase
MLVLNSQEVGMKGFPPKGQIQVILGPMFSGKTTELIRRLKRYQFANHRCLIIKYQRDTRYDKENISTHDHQTMSAVACLQLDTLLTGDLVDQFSVIGIDEGQFFPDTVEFTEQMANRGKTVIVAALDGSYQRRGFGDILNLIPLAESVIKLTAVCMICFEEASFTKRIGAEKQLEVIGGAEKYMAVCRRCYMDDVEDKSNPCTETGDVCQTI